MRLWYCDGLDELRLMPEVWKHGGRSCAVRGAIYVRDEMDKDEYDQWVKDHRPTLIMELEGTARKDAMRHLFLDGADLIKTREVKDGVASIYWLLRVDEHVTANKNTKLITHYYRAVR